MRLRGPALMVLLLLAGCESRRATLAIDLRTDLVPGVELTEIVTRLEGREPVRRRARLQEDLISGQRVVELDELTSGSVSVALDLMGPDGLIVRRPLAVRLEGVDVLVTVTVTRDCRGVSCPGDGDDPAAVACLAGRCVPESCSSARPEDCGAIDDCVEAADCAAAAPCSAAICEAGACLYTPWGDVCGGNEFCDPEAGCATIPARECGPFEATQVVAGEGSSCAIVPGGDLLCWGSNYTGQLGDGSSADATRQTPGRVPLPGPVTLVALGGLHACAIVEDGELYCWGYNAFGQVGSGEAGEDVMRPVRVGTDSGWTRVATGLQSTCGIRDGGLYCWGRNDSGLGSGDTAPATSPARVGDATDWDEVSVGYRLGADASHACGLRGGALYCWGSNDQGQLGLGDLDDRVDVTRVGMDTDWRAVGVNGQYTCGMREDGSVWCWGLHPVGAPGAPWTSTPQRVGARSYEAMSVGPSTVFAVDAEGAVDCWGNGRSGICGDGTYDHRVDPSPGWLGRSFSFVSAGREHACGLSDGAVHCTGWHWGWMAGTRDDIDDQLSPTPVCAP